MPVNVVLFVGHIPAFPITPQVLQKLYCWKAP